METAKWYVTLHTYVTCNSKWVKILHLSFSYTCSAAIGQFCVNLVGVMSQHSLRAQIMQLSRSLLSLLEHFPATRWAVGTANPSREHMNTVLFSGGPD